MTSTSQTPVPPQTPGGAGAPQAGVNSRDRRRGSDQPGPLHALRHARLRLHEDTELATLLTAWAEERFPEDQVKRAFIEAEVEDRLRSYRSWAKFWRMLQLSTWLLIAILGLLITIFAGLKIGHVFTIVAGALVATLTTLTNAMHPAKQADAYLIARLALRDEGWDLVTCTGAYAPFEARNDSARFDQFRAKVREIVRTKRAGTNLDALAPG